MEHGVSRLAMTLWALYGVGSRLGMHVIGFS
jgi:hypothetical protein